jgi:hypothetical protein
VRFIYASAFRLVFTACAVRPARSKAATALTCVVDVGQSLVSGRSQFGYNLPKRTCDGCRKRQEMLNEVLAHKLKEEAGEVNNHGPGVGEKD